jgi:F-type H+-transporting ATPase subunit epsilon
VTDGKLTLTLVTPERALLDKVTCSEVTLPGEQGELGILPAHTPLITLLGIGTVSWKEGASRGTVAVCGGFAEIANDVVRILADAAATKETIDTAAAARDKQVAEERRASVTSEEQLDAVNADAAFAETRLKVAAGS